MRAITRLNSLRIEKAYRHWGHDITDEDTPLEAGLDFAVKWDKAGRIHRPRGAGCGRGNQGCLKRLVQFQAQVARAPCSTTTNLFGRVTPSSDAFARECMPIRWARRWALDT